MGEGWQTWTSGPSLTPSSLSADLTGREQAWCRYRIQCKGEGCSCIYICTVLGEGGAGTMYNVQVFKKEVHKKLQCTLPTEGGVSKVCNAQDLGAVQI